MTPQDFILKWKANTRAERAAVQEHFIDLCALLNEPTPNTDPTGATYAFEKGATKATGGEGWADVWKRACFGWEYKGKHKDLEAAHRQLLLYAGALENPPLLITSDIERIVIRTNWTNAVSARHEVTLEDLQDPAKRALLKAAFSEPDRLRPTKTRQALTEQAAADFAELARRLRARGHDPHDVAHFVIRLVFCLFADDVALLPQGLFERMLHAAQANPPRFADFASRLFRAMKDPGGEIDFTPVPWFNGGLFDDDTALALDLADIKLLARVAALDWAEIDPSILGTLFERGLDPDKRSQLGAHYTDREKIGRLVDATITRPLLAEWAGVKAGIAAALEREAAATNTRAKNKAAAEASAAYKVFLDRLRGFRVLDPACGSGNFLYLALLALKDLEVRASVEAEALGLPREFPQVGPEAVCGIEINPYAAELARVSVWIGHIQWARRNGLPLPSDPVLRPLQNIECRDAVLTPDGQPAPWPKADAIIGNPPFLGDKAMIGTLGEDYTTRLRAAYAGRLPGGVDLVCYWFERAREELAAGRTERVGLVATQAIRKGASRSVLDRIQADATIFEAWSNEPWNLDGADVRVSLVAFAKQHDGPAMLDGAAVPAIHGDLSAGESNLTTAQKLNENRDLCFQGFIAVGAFDIPGSVARGWLAEPLNPNQLPNSAVVKPWVNARDLLYRDTDTWSIDFGTSMTEREASMFIKPYAHAAEVVAPERAKVRRSGHRDFWWRYGESRPAMRRALAPLKRCVVTPKVAKHRLFLWVDTRILISQQFYVFAKDDDVFFGVLQSRFHEVWALRLASRHGVGNDPSYTPSATFETFPFPDGQTPNLPGASYAEEPRAMAIAEAARALVEARNRWLNPEDLVETVPEVVPGFPDRILPRNAAAAQALKARTLTKLYNTRGTPEGAWLDGLHQRLDEAVAAAYGWPANITEEDALAALLALNHARPAAG
ncbi:MAG: class I SAM-dependent DNA methyltransferase [Roseomonas sp.]|nr:class I SAM-dependent DNA methyltransferase [Roseomonas sp.]MCA3429651.1 class I SAM-dependent DNA methyltransferase [Roseomonas sp.]MCA3433545.1 class I SAM-dependent DNA methyltransferase [Roseomonas sp.]